MNKLDFFQEGNFSSRICLVFDFIKQNYIALLTAGAYLLPAVILINCIALHFNIGLLGSLFAFILFNGIIFLLYALYIGTYAMEYTLSDNPQSITLHYIGSKVFKTFLPILATYILIFFGMVGFGFTLDLIANSGNPFVTMGLIVIPCIWVSVIVVLFIPAYLYSNNGIINAVKESYCLVKGKWWRSFIFFATCFGITYVLVFSVVITMITYSHLPGVAKIFIAIAISFFVTPINIVGLHVLYTDLKEGRKGAKCTSSFLISL